MWRKISTYEWTEIFNWISLLSKWNIKLRDSAKFICHCWQAFECMLGRVKAWGTKSCWCSKKSYTNKRIRSIYYSAKKRCNKKSSISYKYYWWKGIKFLFKNIAEFESYMLDSYIDHLKSHWEKNTTLDRIDPEWNYEPWNVRWATVCEQANNTSRNVYATYNGFTLTKSEWLRKLWFIN